MWDEKYRNLALRTRRAADMESAYLAPIGKRTRMGSGACDENDRLLQEYVEKKARSDKTVPIDVLWRQRSHMAQLANPFRQVPLDDDLTDAITKAFGDLEKESNFWMLLELQELVISYALPRLKTRGQINLPRFVNSITHSDRFLFAVSTNPVVVTAYTLDRSFQKVGSTELKEPTTDISFVYPNGVNYHKGWLVVADKNGGVLRFVDVRSADPSEWKWLDKTYAPPARRLHYPRVLGSDNGYLFVFSLEYAFMVFVMADTQDALELTPHLDFSGCYVPVPETPMLISTYGFMDRNCVTVISNFSNRRDWIHEFNAPKDQCLQFVAYSGGKLYAIDQKHNAIMIVDAKLGGKIASILIDWSDTSPIFRADLVDGHLFLLQFSGLLTVLPLPIFATPNK